MKVQLVCIGKTAFDFISEGIDLYEKRIKHYVQFELKVLPSLKNTRNLTISQIKDKEGALLLKAINDKSTVVLLDVKGKQIDSGGFANFVNSRILDSNKELTFIVGGAYGFSLELYNKATFKISLSSMTMSHQLVRLLFMEQLYRAFTILKGEPYHH